MLTKNVFIFSVLLAGPFLIAFGSEKSLQYWTVSDNFTVRGTRNAQEASLFFITPSETGSHPYEFHIAYMGDDHLQSTPTLSQKALNVIPRYLNANVSAFGTNSGPLRLEYHVSGHSRLLLFERVADKKGPSSIQTWVQGQDMFFINCARRWMKRDGYIAVKQNDEEEWITCCVARRSSHDDTNTFLLFRLLPASYRDNPELFAAQQGNIAATGLDKVLFNGHDNVQSLDKQLEQYGKGPAPEAFRAPLSLLTQQWSAIPGSREIN